jgi:hypothetical protein
MPRLHRNNAAEWVMAIILSPLRGAMRLFKRDRRNRASREPSGSTRLSSPKSAAGPVAKKPPSRPVTIEGLPPRTMN